MTVIAYKDGIMAADSNASYDYLTVAQVHKTIRTKHGFLIGGAGSAGDVSEAFARLQDLENIRQLYGEEIISGESQLLIVTPKGKIYVVDHAGVITVRGKFAVLGSGSAVALTALTLGHSAAEAVNVAKKLVPGCGGKTRTIKLKART